jgi:hypothetical protein
MAITIQAQLAKKLPIPGSQFSSHQASITISAEVTDLGQVAHEAERLYAACEHAVDAQLGIKPQDGPAAAPPAAPPRQPSAASQPYQPKVSRRGPAPVTDSQLRFLDKLITQTGTSLPAILQHHQVGSLDQLSCKVAAGLIDELKSRVPA